MALEAKAKFHALVNCLGSGVIQRNVPHPWNDKSYDLSLGLSSNWDLAGHMESV